MYNILAFFSRPPQQHHTEPDIGVAATHVQMRITRLDKGDIYDQLSMDTAGLHPVFFTVCTDLASLAEEKHLHIKNKCNHGSRKKNQAHQSKTKEQIPEEFSVGYQLQVFGLLVSPTQLRSAVKVYE